MLFRNQTNHSYLISCFSVGKQLIILFPYFIAGVLVPIIPWEDFVYLFDPHSRDTFSIPSKDRVSLNINFHSYESAASYIYVLYVNSLDAQFDNQFIIVL